MEFANESGVENHEGKAHLFISPPLFVLSSNERSSSIHATRLTVINDALLLLRLRTATPGSACN